MKALAVFSCLVMCSYSVFSTGNEKRVIAGIQNVTVFYSGAQVQRSSGTVTLEKGQTLLVLEGLEQHLSENSIRAGLAGAGKILSVVRRIDYLQQGTANKEIAELELRYKNIEKEREEVNLNTMVYEQEKNLLLNNMKLGSEQQGVQITELKEAADFYRLRMGEIEKQLLGNRRKIKDLQEESEKIRRQLNELNYQKNKPSSTLEVWVEMASAGQTKVILDYFVPGARWVPVYDIRVDEIGKPVSIVRKATVMQSTGTDWENIQLTFSTGNPQERASKPDLNPWYLREVYPEPVVQLNENVTRSATAARKAAAVEEVTFEFDAEAEVGQTMIGSIPTAEIGAKNSLLEFKLSSPATVPSDNKENTMLIGAMDVKAIFEYHTVPKLDPSAYLMALIPDWDVYDLLDGNANIYYEGIFVGKTYIRASSTLDSLRISLGKDKEIMVERKQIKEFSTDRLIGPNRKKDFGFENIIRNAKDVPVTVIVEDQYPISTLKDIEVIQEDHGGGTVDRVSGKVTWKQSIKAGETVRLPLKYSVKYPAEKQINL